jgi:hypothetical protein
VRRSESRMREHAAGIPKSKPKSKEKRELKTKRNEWRITKMVLAIFLSFLICYLPITIVKVADNEVQFPGTQHSYQLHDMCMCLTCMWQTGINFPEEVHATVSTPPLLLIYQTTRCHFQKANINILFTADITLSLIQY